MGTTYTRSTSTEGPAEGIREQGSSSIKRLRKPSSSQQKCEESDASSNAADAISTPGSETMEQQPKKQSQESELPVLKKRSQSLDAGRLNQHKKLIGSRVEKFRRKSRKKSVDSIDGGSVDIQRIEKLRLDKSDIEEEDRDPLEDLGDPPVEITQDQRENIKRTWKIIEANVARVGVVLFMGLFETHPDVQEVFLPFRGLATNELRESRQLRSHALRVMGFVEKAVGRLDRPDKLMALIQECGRNHSNYGVKASYIDHVGPQFLLAIKPALEDEWCREVEDSWTLFMTTLAYVMKKALIEAQEKQKKEKGASS